MPVSISGDGAITGLELESFEDVDVGSGASDGDVLTYDATGDLWIPQGVELPAGIGSNVVHTQITTTFSTSSTTLTNFTNVDVTITPSSNTAKILVIYTCGKMSGTTDNFTTQHVIARDTTTISPIFEQKSNPAGSFVRFGASIMTLDAPTTASAVTYRARVNIDAGTLTVGNASIIAIEVAV